MTNTAKMKVRKYKRCPIPMEDELLKDMHAREHGEALTLRPDHHLDYRRLTVEIDRFLSNATETNRALFIGMEVEGASKETIAARHDLTVPAVKTRLHRMRTGLREHIEAYQEDRFAAQSVAA